MKINLVSFIMLGLFMVSFGCSTSKKTTDPSEKIAKLNEVDGLDPTIPLSEHLRKLPGVTVSGSGQNIIITLKGFKSYSGIAEPLYVVDGKIFNGGYQAIATSVEVADIKSIRIIKDLVERQEYGMKGSNGVIEIKLKK